MHHFLATVVVLAVVTAGGQAARQWFGVQGTIKCGNEPAKNARVWLYDIDTGAILTGASLNRHFDAQVSTIRWRRTVRTRRATFSWAAMPTTHSA
jgi:hypothetical protein